jgi:hypothetical protein
LLIWIGPSGEFQIKARRRTTEHGRTDALPGLSTFLRIERSSLLLVSALFRFLLFLRESSRCRLLTLEHSEVFSSSSPLHGSTLIGLLRTICAGQKRYFKFTVENKMIYRTYRMIIRCWMLTMDAAHWRKSIVQLIQMV